MTRLAAPVAGLALALLIGAGALVANAREPRLDRADAAANGSIGSVDMEEIYNASGDPAELEQAARQHEAEGEQRINKIMAVPYLEPNELEEFGALIGKGKMTPEEEKRADALKALNSDRAGELKTLQVQGGALAPAAQARLTHLTELRQTLQSQVRPGLIADFRAQHEGWIGDFRHQQIVALRKEVAKIAKDRGIAHVFDANALVYSVNDLTATVLQRMDKRGEHH
jgi:Skp family chaperone for outer membrane proteins